MKTRSTFAIAPLLTLGLALAGAAHAGNWQLQFNATGTVWGPDSELYPLTQLTLNIVTSDVLTTGPFSGQMGAGYSILGMTGTRNGVAVTALLPTTTNPYSWTPDPTLYVSSPQLISFDGLMYQTAAGDVYDLYGSTFSFGGPPDVQWFEATQLPTSSPYTDHVFFTGTTTLAPLPAVPEPSTWALMVGGAALLGGVARKRRAVGQAA